MTSTLQLDIVSAEDRLFSGAVKMIFAAGAAGELGIAFGHAPLITLLNPGCIRAILPDDVEKVFYVSGGSLEVQPDIVTILADTAIRAEDLDESLALEAKKQAEAHLTGTRRDKDQEFDYAASLRDVAEAAAKLHVINKLRSVKKKA